MSFLLRQVAHCDVCGHEWLTKKVPSHCAKCKSRKWNSAARPFEVHIASEDMDALEKTVASARRVAPERTVEYEE